MNIMKSKIRLLYILPVIFAVGVMAGCDTFKKAPAKDEIIAKINGYELTVNDFKEETKLISANAVTGADTDKAKEYALDEIITKKILLQEAQRENFDKDEKFMKEIERYWEQALLKLLLKKKIDEFSAKISPDIESETKQKMLKAEIARWVTDLKKTAKIKIYKENLKK